MHTAFRSKDHLITEIKLKEIDVDLFLCVVEKGQLNIIEITKILNKDEKQIRESAKRLVDLGGMIDMPNDRIEALHPRFAAVNMYRRYCQREEIKFAKNKNVDSIGIELEKPYERVRTK